MSETSHGAIEVKATRVGHTDLGEGTASVDDDALTVLTRSNGGERMLRIPLSAVDTVVLDGDEFVVAVRDGRQVSMTTAGGAQLRDDIVARCFTLPELTRTLRAFGSRRGQGGRRPTAAAEQQRFFAPFVDARRSASKNPSPAETIAAFESADLVRSLDDALRRFAVERFGQNGPARRALEAELVDSSEPLHAALRALAERAFEARDRAGEIRAWRAWAVSLHAVFEAADRVWVALDVALDGAHATASRLP